MAQRSMLLEFHDDNPLSQLQVRVANVTIHHRNSSESITVDHRTNFGTQNTSRTKNRKKNPTEKCARLVNINVIFDENDKTMNGYPQFNGKKGRQKNSAIPYFRGFVPNRPGVSILLDVAHPLLMFGFTLKLILNSTTAFQHNSP